jgi:hypothetical protein
MKSQQFMFFVALVTLVGCNRGVEPFDTGDNPQTAPIAATSPKPTTQGSPPAGSATETLEGTLQIAPALAKKLPNNAVLFLIARRAAQGPPLAVKRMPVPNFPYHFSIGPDDRMIKSMPFQGPIKLSARIDADGNAMTRTPGDLHSNSDTSHKPGARGITLLIDEII